LGTEQVVERDFIGTLRWIFESKLFMVGKTEITLLVILELFFAIIAFYAISKYQKFCKSF